MPANTLAMLLGGAAIIIGAILLWVTFFVPQVYAAERLCGEASWYGTESGNRTANGEPFTGKSLTAAHRSLPFGTRLKVTYKGKSVVVRINDRGPAKWTGRFLDLSKAAASQLGLIPRGHDYVCAEVLGKAQRTASTKSASAPPRSASKSTSKASVSAVFKSFMASIR